MSKRGGKRIGAGNPGYGKMQAVKNGVEKLAPLWFELAETWLTDGSKSGQQNQRLAFVEIGKLIAKLLPTQLTGQNGPVEFIIKRYDGRPDVHYIEKHTLRLPNYSATTPILDYPQVSKIDPN